ncbi:MAG TPA: beta-galactosidase, partial [Armatimonadota bacterium]|nr:beta-galactosidase [Armatimonadota bacterium]
MGRAVAAALVASGTIGLITSGALAQTDAPLDDFERENGPSWSFSNGPEFPGASGHFERSPDAAHSGAHGGRLYFDFSAGGAYVQATVGLPAEPPAGAVELFARKTVTNSITVRAVDQQGQTFQKTFNFPEGDWRHLRIRMDGWSHHWGGPNDGVFHGAAKALGLLVERGEATTGSVDFDDLTIVPAAHPAESARSIHEYVVARFGPEEGWGFWVSGPAGGTQRDGGRVQYDFSLGASELHLGNDEALLGRPVSLRLRVRSDGSGHAVRMNLGSHFQSFWRTLGTLDEPGEMVLEAPLGGMTEWEHGGGENDGVVRLPLRLLNLSLARREGGPERGDIEFLELSVQTDVPPDRLLFPLARGPAAAGDPFRLTMRSLAAEPSDARVTCSLRDFSGRVLRTEEHAMTLPASAQPVALQVPADVADVPFLEAEFRIQAPGQKPATAAACWVMPWPDEGSAELDPASPWGMGLYLYRYGGDAAGLAQMDRAAALARAAGVKWTREEFQWHRIEPRPGEFDWTFYDALVDTATRHGISVYGLIAYWSSWTQPYTDQGVEDYCRFVRALVGHYKDRIKHWEIWNEPNIFFWSGPKELYFTLLDRAYAAVKDVDPEAVVFGCSTAGIDQDFIRRTMEAGARFDGLTIHPYRAVLDDLGFQQELRQVADLVAAAGPAKPVWITEMGWPTEVGATSERDQANLLARCYVGAVA